MTQPARHRPAFTLMELLVVMGIIVLIAAVSIPAFKFITGARSVDSGINLVNAMVGRARTAAIVNGEPYGVFFYVDPRNDRSTLALVHQNAFDSEGHGWATLDTAGQSVDANGTSTGAVPPVTYFDATNPDIDPSAAQQMVLVQQPSEQILGVNGTFSRYAAITFQCVKTHQPAIGNNMTGVPVYTSTYWNDNTGGLDIARDTELQLLPPGVGAAVVVDPQISRFNTAPGTTRLGVDRYLRTGCILFDGKGQFAPLNYDVFSTSHLGQALFLDKLTQTAINLQPSLSLGQEANNQLTLYGGYGVVLFDREALLADAKVNGYTEGDYYYGNGAAMNTLHLPAYPYGPEPASETVPLVPTDANATPAKKEFLKQAWLDANGTLLTATRYNGSLTRSE